mgnify:CR=1 FL=1
MKLKLALFSFREQNKYEKVEFFGRIRGIDRVIEGISRDYFIIVGTVFTRLQSFPTRDFYWSNDSFVFAPLPAVSSEAGAFLSVLNGYFSGEHDKILRETSGAHKHIDLEDDNRMHPLNRNNKQGKQCHQDHRTGETLLRCPPYRS